MRFLFLLYIVFFSWILKAQQWEKAKAFDYINPNSVTRHITDKSGNTYVVGEIKDNPLIIDGKSFSTNGSTDVFIAKLDSNFLLVWAKSYGGKGKDAVCGVTLDDSGDIIISGYFSQNMQIDEDTLKSLGFADFFLAKIDPMGNSVWAKSGGSKYEDYANGMGGVVCDSVNNIYVAGMFADEFDHGSKRTAWFDSDSVISFGDQDIFVAKYSPNGEIKWVKNFGSYRDDGGEIYLNDDFIYVCGGTNWQFHYDSSTLKNPYGGADIGFILKMDLDGRINWVKGCFLKDVGSMYTRSVTGDSLGNVYFTGMYYPISFNNRLVFGNFELEGIGGTDIFVGKLDKYGKVKWLKRGGGGSNDAPSKIITKNNNHFIITGSINGGGFYENKTIESFTGPNTFILEIDSNGKPIVFEQCGNTGDNIGTDLSIMKDGKLIITGDNRVGALTFDSITLPAIDKPSSFYIARRNFVTKPVSTSMNLKPNGFKLYPNPNTGSFTIEIENPSKDMGMYIYNLVGENVKKIEKVEKVNAIDLEVVEGIYLIKLMDKEKVYYQKVSIVK